MCLKELNIASMSLHLFHKSSIIPGNHLYYVIKSINFIEVIKCTIKALIKYRYN